MNWKPLKNHDDESPPTAFGSSLDQLARRLGLAPTQALASVFGRWEDVVGQPMATHVHPISLRKGVLVVAVDEPGWATQVRYLADDLRDRCNERAGHGTVTSVVVHVRGVRTVPPWAKGRRSSPS